jgi:hypothetical protein
MNRLVLGIIIVFCLQLGYVAYTAINSPIETWVAVNEVTSGTNPIADPISDPVEFLNEDADLEPNGVNSEKIASTPERRKSKRSAGATLVSSKEVVKIPAARIVNRVPQFVALRKPSETTLRTEYPRVILYDRESENYQLSAKTVQRSKKRSFISKSFSVLKKPYDLLKALGSRLN